MDNKFYLVNNAEFGIALGMQFDGATQDSPPDAKRIPPDATGSDKVVARWPSGVRWAMRNVTGGDQRMRERRLAADVRF